MPTFSMELWASMAFRSLSVVAYKIPISAEAVPTPSAIRPAVTCVAGSRSALTRMMPYRPRFSVAPASTGANARGAAAYARCNHELTGTRPALTPKPKNVSRKMLQRTSVPRLAEAPFRTLNCSELAPSASNKKPTAAATVPASPMASSK